MLQPLEAYGGSLEEPPDRVGRTLQPISWEDATSIVAEVGRYVIDKYGEHAWGMKQHSYQFFENTYAETKLALQSVETPVWAHCVHRGGPVFTKRDHGLCPAHRVRKGEKNQPL